jgi:hypothetical protein
MYLELTSNIRIGSYTLEGFAECEIVKSAKVLQDTATIKIPATAVLVSNNDILTEVPTASQIRVGDAVTIDLGYNGDNKTEFKGFVKKVIPATPTVIECEDSTYLLRQKSIKKSWSKVSLKEVLDYILNGTGISLANKVPGINFVNLRLIDVSPAAVLQSFIEKYALTIYFKSEKKLFIGLAFDTEDLTIVKYELGRNTISDDLEVVNDSDTALRVKAIAILPNGTKIETEIGDGAEADNMTKRKGQTDETIKAEDAEVRTLHFYNIQSEKELKEIARAELRKRKFTGFKGSITTFLQPYCEVGNAASITDEIYTERGDGDYLIEKTTTSVTQSGGRRKVELGLKVK